MDFSVYTDSSILLSESLRDGVYASSHNIQKRSSFTYAPYRSASTKNKGALPKGNVHIKRHNRGNETHPYEDDTHVRTYIADAHVYAIVYLQEAMSRT